MFLTKPEVLHGLNDDVSANLNVTRDFLNMIFLHKMECEHFNLVTFKNLQ